MAGPVNQTSAERAIRLAMRDAGILQRGDEPSSEDYEEYLGRLNDMIGQWTTKGLKLFLNQALTVPLVAGTASYTLGPGGSIISTKPYRVLDGSYVLASGNSRPLDMMSWATYRALSNPDQQGTVTGFLVDKQQSNIVITLWLVPDTTAATGTLDLLIQRAAAQITSLTQDTSFPTEWFMALRWGLADEISSGQPQQIQDRCQKKATEFFEALNDWDVEDSSTTFTPNLQGADSRFR